MPVYDQGYSRWKGEIKPNPLRWWPILRRGTLPELKRRRNLFFLAIAWIFVLVQGVILYANTKTAALLESGLLDTGPGYFYKTLNMQGVAVLVFVLLVGADLIAKDRRYNALQVYFSRPLTSNDYIMGKLGVVASFMFLVTWLPVMLLWLFAVSITTTAGYFASVWAVPFAITAYCAVWTLVAGLLVLTLSAIGQRGVFIAGSWLILYGYGLFVVIVLMRALTGNEYLGLLNLDSNVKHVGAWIFGVDGPHEYHPALSLAVLVIVVGICYRVLVKRIRPVEVVL